MGWYCSECKKEVNVNAFVGQMGDFDSTETLEQIKAFIASEAPMDFQVECVECDHIAEWRD